MFSIIVCTISPEKQERIQAHYERLMQGQPYELFFVQDAKSLAEGYNRGINHANGDVLIFSHDDIEFLTPETWLERLQSHLERYDLVGLAGTDRLITAAWAQSGPVHTFGHVAEVDHGTFGRYRLLVFSTPYRAIPNIQAMDGLFLAANRRVLETLRFDEQTFDGFHCYDVDFTFSAHLAGFKLAVATDIPVVHYSQGTFDPKWEVYAERLINKHHRNFYPKDVSNFHHAVVGTKDKGELLDLMTPFWLFETDR